MTRKTLYFIQRLLEAVANVVDEEIARSLREEEREKRVEGEG